MTSAEPMPPAEPATAGDEDAWTRRALVAAGLLALFLRLPMLTWGLPLAEHEYMIHPDEWGPANQAIHWPVTPVWALYSAYPTLLPALMANGTPISTLLLTLDRVHGDPNRAWLQLLLFGRLLSVLLTVGGVLAVTAAAARLFRNRTATAAAAVAAAAAIWPAHNALFVVGDAAAAGWVGASLWAAAGVVRYGRRSDYSLAGLFAGLAAGTKYSAGAVALSVAVAWGIDGWERRRAREAFVAWVKDGAVAAGVALVATVLANPVLVLNLPAFLERLGYEAAIIRNHRGMPLSEYAAFVPRTFALVLGWPVAALLALSVVGWRRRGGVLLLLLAPVLAFVVGARGFYDWHLLVVTPPAFLLLALGVATLTRAESPGERPIGRLVHIGLCVAVLVCALTVCQRVGDVRRSRAVAEDLAARIAPGSDLYLVSKAEYGLPILRQDVRLYLHEGGGINKTWTEARYLLLHDDVEEEALSLLPALDPKTWRLREEERYRVSLDQLPAEGFFRVLRALRETPETAPYRVVARWEQPLATLPVPLPRLQHFPRGFTLYERRRP